MTGPTDDVDALFEQNPASRALALALGRFIIGGVFGLVLVWVAAQLVGVPSVAYVLPVILAAVYGILGYRKALGLDAE